MTTTDGGAARLAQFVACAAVILATWIVNVCWWLGSDVQVAMSLLGGASLVISVVALPLWLRRELTLRRTPAADIEETGSAARSI